MNSPAWLDRLRNKGSRNKDTGIRRTLILCRTQAQAQDVRKEIARVGGMVGLEVNTLRGVAAEMMPASIGAPSEDADNRPDNSLLARVGEDGERPGLESHLKRLLAAFRLKEQADGPIDRSSFQGRLQALAELADTGWGQEESERALSCLLKTTASNPPADTDVYCLGFDTPHTPWGLAKPMKWESAFVSEWLPTEERMTHRVTSWEGKILKQIHATRLMPETECDEPGVIPAVRVPDVCAEVKLATKMLLRAKNKKRSALVLVPDTNTADRLRAAAKAAGVAIAGSASMGYGAHALAPLLKVTLSWFEQSESSEQNPNPVIRAAQISTVLGNPFVGNRFPKAVRQRLLKKISTIRKQHGASPPADEYQELRLSASQLNQILSRARIAEAPLEDWISRFESLAAKPSSPLSEREKRSIVEDRRRATLLLERLQRLSACVHGTAFSEDYTTDDDLEENHMPEEQDMIGASLIDDRPGRFPAAGTFGALRRFFLDCHLRLRADRLGKAMLAELAARRNDSISGRELARLLGGSASLGVLSDGIAILPYEDFDGRAVHTLVLLGVHNKGISAAPSPDPILQNKDLSILSLPTGKEIVTHRMLQAMRAAALSRSGDVLAIVTDRDSTGRAVVPPIQLPLDFDSAGDRLRRRLLPKGLDISKDSYGHALDRHDRPEILEANPRPIHWKDIQSLQDPTIPGAGAHPRNRHMAIQASAEWYRQGAGEMALGELHGRYLSGALRPDEEVPEIGRMTLGEKVAFHEKLGPAWAMPYLGEVGPLPDTWNQDTGGETRQWSHSNHFDPLTNCLYRFFAERVLRISETEPISDELDNKEVGTVVHGAFEAADKGKNQIPWRVHGDAAEVEGAMAHAYDRLCTLSTQGFAEANDNMGVKNLAVSAATDGVAMRWRNRFGKQEVDADGANVWAGYVKERIKSTEDMNEQRFNHVKKLIEPPPEQEAIEVAMAEKLKDWTVKDAANKIRGWAKKTLDSVMRNGPDALLNPDITPDELLHKMPKMNFEHLKELVQSDSFQKLISSFLERVAEAEKEAAVFVGRMTGSQSEFRFGAEGNANTKRLELQLGDHAVPVKGSIDRILVLKCAKGDVRLQLLDYKTGGIDKSVASGINDLSKPQLPLYALAMATLLDRKGSKVVGIPKNAVVSQLAYDFARHPNGLIDDIVVTEETLERFREKLGELISLAKAGTFWPLPHADRSWGWPKGNITLESAARFVKPISLPEPEEDEENDFDKKGVTP